MLLPRLISAAIGIPLVVAAIWLGGALLAGVIAVAVFIAVLEVAAARKVANSPAALVPPLLAGLMPVAALAGLDWFLAAIVLTILVLGSGFTLTKEPHRGVETWLWGLVPALYVGVLAAHFILLRELPDGRDLVLFTVLTVWSTDTGAYAVGRLIGRHKLSPVISPGKTIEGGIGSWVTGLITVFVLAAALGLGLSTLHLVVLGLVLPPVILVGDLAESALKRALDVKDSGFLVPGHGGILDRLDSLLFAAPVVYYYVEFVIRS